MFKFAVKNLLIKKLNVILIIVSIMLSAGTALLAYNTAEQVSEGITNTATYFSVVIGPDGSATQLVMNTMYFTDEPVGTIPENVMFSLQSDARVATVKDENGQTVKDKDGLDLKYVVPFATGDTYHGYNCVGTSTLFFEGKTLKEGDWFDDDGTKQAVVGWEVARANDLEIGQVVHTGHPSGQLHNGEDDGITIVGILDRTYSAYDNILFTEIQTFWDLHEEEEHEEHEEHEEGEVHVHAGMVCSVLVKTTDPNAAVKLADDYNGKVVTDDDGKVVTDDDGHPFKLQAREPMSIVRNVLEDADSTKYIVFVLCGIILAMNILVICIITLLNMNYSAKEIRLMRLIGVSMKKISLLYVIENGIIGLFSTVLAFLTSKLCAGLVSDYVQNMGVVLNRTKIYPLEFAIMAGVLLITVLPTLICTKVIGEKDAV